MSVSEDIRPTTPNIDYNLCLSDEPSSSSCPTHVRTSNNLNMRSHIVFVRDIAPYQKISNQPDNSYQDINNDGFKEKYPVNIHGLQMSYDRKCANILPEIKVSIV